MTRSAGVRGRQGFFVGQHHVRLLPRSAGSDRSGHGPRIGPRRRPTSTSTSTNPASTEPAIRTSPGRSGRRRRPCGTPGNPGCRASRHRAARRPGRRTRQASARSASWAATVGTWWSIVIATPAREPAGRNGIATASAWTTVTLAPVIRRCEAPRRPSRPPRPRSACRVRDRRTSVVRPGPGPISRTLPPSGRSPTTHGTSVVPDVRAPRCAGAQLAMSAVHVTSSPSMASSS